MARESHINDGDCIAPFDLGKAGHGAGVPT